MTTLNIFLTDDAGNAGSGVFTIAMNKPSLVVNISPILATYTEGTPLTFIVNTSGSNPNISWNVTKNGTFYISGTGSTIKFTPNDAGTYYITVNVTSGGLSGIANKTLTITNVAPTAGTNGPYSSTVGQTINFIGTATDPGSLDTFTWLWDFGDNTQSTLQSPTHSYAAASTYTVKLTIIDQHGGVGTVITNATISAIPVPPPPSVGAVCTTKINVIPNPLNMVLQPGQALAINYNFTNCKSAQLFTPAGPITVPINQATLNGSGVLNYIPNQPGIGNISNVLFFQVVDPSGVATSFRFNSIVQDQASLPALDPTIIPSVSNSVSGYYVSTKSGSYLDPTVWNTPVPPTRDSIVVMQNGYTINGTGRTCQAGRLICQAGSTFTFNNGAFYCTDLDNQPGSTVVFGDGQMPAILISRNRSSHPNDVNKFWPAINIAGSFTTNGQVVTPLSRLVGDAHAGDMSLSLKTPVTNWQISNKFYLADTRLTDKPFQGTTTMPWFEICQIRAVSSDGKTVYLLEPLQYDHIASYRSDGSLHKTAHVGHLVRSTAILSTDPTDMKTRAHCYVSGKATLNLSYTTFHGLGRTTNQPIGPANPGDRYCLNIKDLIGPAGGLPSPFNNYQYRIEGCTLIDPWPVVNQSKARWGLNVSNSHYGLIDNNISFNWYGAGFHFNTGNEAYNKFTNNATFYIVGNGGRGDYQPPGGSSLDLGIQGAGVWIRGPFNYIQNNVSANIYNDNTGGPYGYGMIWFFGSSSVGTSPKVYIPNFQGANTADPTQSTLVNISYSSLLPSGCVGNEIYSSLWGYTYWYVGMDESQLPQGVGESKFSSFDIWHVRNRALFPYISDHLTLDGMTVVGDLSLLGGNFGYGGYGIVANDYGQNNFLAQNLDFDCLQECVTAAQTLQNLSVTSFGNVTYRNCQLRGNICLRIQTQWNSGYTSKWMTGRKILLDNVLCDISKMPAVWGVPPVEIVMDYEPTLQGSRSLTNLDHTTVTNYKQIVGNNFNLYYNQQVGSFVMPTTILNSDGTPSTAGQPAAGSLLVDGTVTAGNLTNAQLVSHGNLPFAGELSPSTAITKPGIQGLCG